MALAMVMSMGVVVITPMLVVVMIVTCWGAEIRLLVIVGFHGDRTIAYTMILGQSSSRRPGKRSVPLCTLYKSSKPRRFAYGQERIPSYLSRPPMQRYFTSMNSSIP